MIGNRSTQDESLESPFDYKQFKRLLSYTKPYKFMVIGALILAIISAACNLSGPLLLKIAIDNYMVEGAYKQLTTLSLIFVMINAISMVCFRYRERIMAIAGHNMIYDIRQDLFNHIQTLSFAFYDSRPAGKVLVRIINDVNSLGDLLKNGIINVLIDCITLVIVVGMMMYLHVKLAFIALITFPIMFIIIMSLKRFIRLKWQIVRRKNSNMNAYLHESLAGMRVTQAFGREKETHQLYERLSSDIYSSWIDAIKINNILWPIVHIISVVGSVLVYWFGIRFIDNNTVTVGILIAFISYIGRFWQPIINLSNFYNSLLMAMASIERIFEMMDIEADIKDSINAIEMPEIKGEVEFSDMSFYYQPEKRILENVNFTVNAGETIALVGPTGAGKSTIVNLISRFYDVIEGSVLVDGQDIRDVTLNSLRSQMGVMLQDSFIFSGNIMENIRYGRLEATDEEVMEAAKLVHADDFINEMRDGYYTQVQERGSRLSQGQRQLISFARALLADPRILILDEATSSIDTETEMLVQKGLENLLKGRTSFVIAHRLSTIRNADRIMVIDNKTIMESGSHEELMEQKGAYYNLYQAQYKFLQAM